MRRGHAGAVAACATPRPLLGVYGYPRRKLGTLPRLQYNDYSESRRAARSADPSRWPMRLEFAYSPTKGSAMSSNRVIDFNPRRVVATQRGLERSLARSTCSLPTRRPSCWPWIEHFARRGSLLLVVEQDGRWVARCSEGRSEAILPIWALPNLTPGDLLLDPNVGPRNRSGSCRPNTQLVAR